MEPQRPAEEETEKGFSISDKRLFTKEGQRRPPAEQPEPSRASAPPPPRQETPPRERAQQTGTRAREASPRDLPPADFSTFVNLLVTNVMMFLGQIPDPVSQQRRRDLPQAKHTIDLLIMLREKTRGNLNPQEEQLLQELLPQLQMAYVSASRQVG